MVIIGKTPNELQQSLDLLKSYCDTWGLEVNTDKTKIVVFRKRGQVFENEKWLYGNSHIEVVNDFNYLGTCFNYTGTFCLNQEVLTGKGLKALNLFYTKLRTIVYHQKYYVNFSMLLLALYCLTAVKYGVLTNVKILKKSI